MDSSTIAIWTWSVFTSRVFSKFLLLLCVIEIPVLIANSVDPDQRPHSAASNLGLYCLTITVLVVSQLRWL